MHFHKTQINSLWHLLSLCILFIGSCAAHTHVKDGIVVPEITQLLELTNVSCEDYTLSAVVEATQKHWLRPADTERWEIEENCDAETAATIFELCDALGYVEARTPQQDRYDYGIIFGATTPVMESYFKRIAELEEQGIVCENIVLLTGDRDLTAAEKTAALPALPTNEIEGAALIYETLDCLDEIRKKPFTHVKAPKKLDALGKLVRPNTKDTLCEWITKFDPQPGSCVCISMQPFCIYQGNVAEGVIPDTFTVEVIGKVAPERYKQRPLLLLDTVARALYQELQNNTQ